MINPDESVWNHWNRHADTAGDREAIVHWRVGEDPYRWTWGSLMEAARTVASRLGEAGVRKGDVCALILQHHENFYPIYMGISTLGAIPSVLAYPNSRLHPEKFRHGLEGMAQRSGLDFVLSDHELEETITPLLRTEKSTVRKILFPLDWFGNGRAASSLPARSPSLPSDACLLQHSSGTTGLQKAVVLSHRAVLEHIKRYGEAIQINPRDKIVSWLPFYHDMGLIAAFYLPLTAGIPLVQLDPFEWVMSPVSLLQAISREAGTLTWLPNFSHNFMADRIHEEDLSEIRLDSLRMAINCSEPVRAESHRRSFDRFRSIGLKQEALSACYAMAETTFAVTQCTPGQAARTILVDRESLASGQVVVMPEGDGVRRCVSSGQLVSGCEIRIVGDQGEELGAGKVGQVVVRSVSLFDEYRNAPELTKRAVIDGWYYTGDFGFLHEGEYFIIGRKTDIINVAGNNIFPEDVEDAIGQVVGVLPGRVIAFGEDDEALGTQKLCVIAETALTTDDDLKKLRRLIIKAGKEIDITVSKVYLVPARWLIKSSAGKPSRSANKKRIQDGDLSHAMPFESSRKNDDG